MIQSKTQSQQLIVNSKSKTQSQQITFPPKKEIIVQASLIIGLLFKQHFLALNCTNGILILILKEYVVFLIVIEQNLTYS